MSIVTTFVHTQLHHQVADRIRAAILEGEIQPGEWLRQEQLAQEYGVSQMPVREALKELAAEGLVEHLPYRGARVIAFSAEDVADLYAHRSFLEGRAARAAASRITPAELAELKRLQAQMKENLAPEYLAEYRQLNRHFHQLIFSASRRAYLGRTLNQMWAAFPNMLWSNFAQTAEKPLPQRDASDPGEHDAIIAALEKGDGAEAERLMQQHILSAGRELVATLEPDPAGF
jgi:DNA-binding GntR family transcriptional regulator